MQEAPDSPRRHCYGCGDANPEGLGIRFRVEGKRVTGEFKARQVHQGFPGVAHGGIAAAAIDEAMGWAMYAAGAWAMTARLEVRYRRPLPLGQPLELSAEVVRDRGRWLEAKGRLRVVGGPLVAEGKGLFMRLPAEEARRMEEFYLAGRA
ncbi:MAG: hotdog fold domain-containing protein [Dehalococcoidia bacterium]